ncbi:hypothetical protein L3Y34_009597 [Caenorhabditis briggsae]|uniref:Uncharacterized protein n=1 Tax=Caenorhabditis briggsae TaxID=6238 RepID=A0AAE9A6C1_CAEBR|nr:hypothetical protein L3Y34_009597 [Caenorhabditis briggsae]
MTVHFAFLHKSSDSSDANCPIITISNSENTCQNFFASRESSFCELQFSNELQYTNELYYTSPLKYVNKLQYAKFELKYINELQYTSKLQYTKNALRTAIVGPFQNFPHNLMRNIARKGSKSGLHILMDGDMIPSQNFAIKIKEIANRIIDGKHKKVLAIRRFETESGMDILTDNKKLLDSKILQRTFEFHHRYFTAGYSIEGLDEWFKKCEETDMVTASLVPYPGYIWEIHPILHRKDPYNADYFPSRVKTMHALIYELCRDGYTFHLPSHVFSIHNGIKHTNTVYSKASITHQEAAAMILARDKFKKEMGEVYPWTLKKLIPTNLYDEQYCIGLNFVEAKDSFRESDGLEPITLSTHATSDMLKTLEKMPNLWDGPISVGIFLDIQTSNALEYLENLYKCVPEFGRKMSIHFAYRISAFQTDCPTVFIPKSKISCDYFLKNQETLRAEISAPFVLYPCSLMRNVARWGAKSDIHFIMDGDMIISEGMALKIKKIANKMIDGKSKNVLLVRRFENANGTVIPRSFEKLEESIRRNQTFEFHHKCFFFGHQIENLPFWLETSSKSPEIISWQIPYSNVDWEPQPILHKNDPYNADYFPSRIKNVQSLIYKLCRANYTFHLLSHVFDVHEGIKTEDTKYSKAVADHQNIYARRTARLRYAEEMSNLYPDTWEKCGVFAL